jgi:hypothetical protein
MARRKAQNPYGSCLAARGRLAARHTRSSSEAIAHQKNAPHTCAKQAHALLRRFPAPGPAFVRSVAHQCADRSISQLLAGTPSGPGGSSAAARVPRCDEARRRRTSSRLRNASRQRPLEGRGGGIISEVRAAGVMRGYSSMHSSSRRKPGFRAKGSERVALDTGFRRYDGVCWEIVEPLS